MEDMISFADMRFFSLETLWLVNCLFRASCKADVEGLPVGKERVIHASCMHEFRPAQLLL